MRKSCTCLVVYTATQNKRHRCFQLHDNTNKHEIPQTSVSPYVGGCVKVQEEIRRHNGTVPAVTEVGDTLSTENLLFKSSKLRRGTFSGTEFE